MGIRYKSGAIPVAVSNYSPLKKEELPDLQATDSIRVGKAPGRCYKPEDLPFTIHSKLSGRKAWGVKCSPFYISVYFSELIFKSSHIMGT